MAFVTDSTIRRLTTLEDLRYLTGRPLCTTNVYGVRLASVTDLFKLIRPDMVALQRNNAARVACSLRDVDLDKIRAEERVLRPSLRDGHQDDSVFTNSATSAP